VPGLMEGKVAVVTGAGGGIGREIAIMMAGAGAKVIVADIGASLHGEGGSQSPAQQTKALIDQRGGQAEICIESVAAWGSAQNRASGAGSLRSYRRGGEQRRHPARWHFSQDVGR
jgi:NAD(P)-dependent dehydrogenase (short-subunit alcohol dehydrogenase family)